MKEIRQIEHMTHFDYCKIRENFKPQEMKPEKPKGSFSPNQMFELEMLGQLNMFGNPKRKEIRHED